MQENKRGVPSFADVDAATSALFDKDNFIPSDLYPRDGTIALAQLESKIAKLVGVSEEEVLLYNTGMTAVTEAIEVAHPTEGTVLLFGQQLYSQTTRYINDHLRPRGVKAVGVDSGSAEDVARAIEKHQPTIVLFETVANGPDMPVLDVDQLVSSGTLRSKKAMVIIDNTLPTPINRNLNWTLTDRGLRVMIVESGTKFYGLNQEMAGLIYTLDEELLMSLKQRRRTLGGQPGISAVDFLGRVLPENFNKFYERTDRIIRNAYALAQAFHYAATKSDRFSVAYPNLPDHPNFDYATRVYPKGSSPVLFLTPEGMDQFELTRMLWANDIIREKCELGQSFGFDKTRIWPDASYPTVRVASGTEDKTELEQICGAIVKTFK